MEFSPGERRLEKTLTLEPKGHPEGFAELSVPLNEGEILSYRWRAREALEFNVHAHRKEEVDYFLESHTAELDGRFKAPREDHFYLMWQNPASTPVEIEFEVWI